MTRQVISTVLEVDASRAVAGFAAGEKAVAGYEKALTSAQRTEGGRRNNSVFDDVPASADKAQGALTRLSGSVRDNRAAWDDLSSKAMIGGAAIAIGIGSATKAAIGWESAWAGVKKTTDGTPEQMAALEGELRELARTLPATHEEIAGVAEAAGQLGVARKDIAGFTETAIALGESTNLSAEEAATGLAKISNVMGTMDREGVKGIERMGSALVALGNDGASTEADILAMAQRLSGAGKMIGATESDILAMSSALSSVGIEAELGGGAMSRALQKMNSAVIAGGKELEGFAEVAGMSASEFATAWRDDPVAAANAFVSGLGKVSDSGGDAAATLDELGLGGTQNAQVLLRAAGASELLTEQLKLGSDAYRDNNALMKEAEQRYATTESRLQVAKNTMKDAAIDAGSVLGPALASLSEKAAGLANTFVQLPKPLQQTATGLAGVAASALLIGGGAVKVIGWGQDISGALDKVGVSTRTADGDLTKFGRTMSTTARWGGYAVGILAVATAIGQVAESANEAPPSIEATTKAILDMRDAAKGTELSEIFTGIGDNMWTGNHVGDINNLADAYERLDNPAVTQRLVDWKDNLFPGLSSGSEQVEASFNRIGESLAQMPADEAARSFEQMVTALGGGQEVRDNLLKWMPAYRDALTGAANDAKLAGDGAEQAGDDISGMGAEMQEAEQAADELAKAIKGLGDATLGQRAGAREYQQTLDDVAKAISENGRTLDINTEAGRANEAALDDLANTTQEWAASVFEATGDVDKAQGILDQGRSKWMTFATSMGMSKREAKALADELFNIDGLEPTVEVKANMAEADEKTDSFQRKMKDIDGQVAEATVTENGAEPARARVLGLEESVQDLTGSTVITVEELGALASTGRVEGLDRKVKTLDGKTVTVQEVGSTTSGERVVILNGKIYALRGKTVDVTARTHGEGALANLQRIINGMSGRNIDVNTYYRDYRQTVDMGTYKARAAGGIDGIQPMAEGGMLPGGSVRPDLYRTSDRGILMAEDTRSKWEAYIPERPDLRPRAEAILEETARRFGKAVVPLEQVTVMASGGITSRWQAQLRNVRSLSNQRRYRWEDGSRMIQVFEDGTARWRGWGAPPAAVSRAINALNAAQDRHEAELNRQEAARRQAQQRQARQRAAQQKAQQRQARQKAARQKDAQRQAALKAAQEKAARRQAALQRRVAEQRRIAREGWSEATGKKYAGRSFVRSDSVKSSSHLGRTYVAPSVSSRGSSGSGGSGGIDGRQVGAQVAAAVGKEMRSWKPMVEISGQRFYGLMVKTKRDRKGR